ncbi:MAG: rhomboid family intramembrane serine protease [Prevotellaceae bacterium]|jgi:membrane associated rhomboid family serine protease|nr:rhomboid family intramembrane serine protease [Prevotellaceae bacterium]
MRNFFGNMPPVVRNLILINALMLLFTSLSNQFMYAHFALYYPGSPMFEPWQFVTYLFMHGGIGHLLFNMYALWLFGNALEYQWGGKKFLTFYLITGIGAALFYMLVLWIQVRYAEAALSPWELEQIYNTINAPDFVDEVRALHARGLGYTGLLGIMTTPMVGASGAVYGVLLGFGMLYPNTVLRFLFPPVALKAKWVVIGYGALELVLGLVNSGGNIAHFAHIGGMLFGFIMIKYWQRKGKMYY